MDFGVNVIIIGDSKSGHAILDKLASSKPKLKFAFISQSFKSTTTHAYSNVKYFRKEVEYVSYRQRLFGCYLNNKDRVFSTHLIIASGLNHEPLIINDEIVPSVFSNIDDIPKTAENQSALIVSKENSETKSAIDLAKKYKHVYLCTKAVDLKDIATAATIKKIEGIENLTVLTNTDIKNIISENGELKKVEFDNYSVIDCSAIYVKTPAIPATDFLPKKIMQKDEANYFVVSEKCESTLVPKCFAAGNCLPKYTKAMEQSLIEAILKDF